MYRLLAMRLVAAILSIYQLSACTQPKKESDNRSEENGADAPTAMALSRAEAIAKVVDDLRAAGMPEPDIGTVKAAMEQAGAGFGLQDHVLNDMLAAMADAAVRSLGDMASAQADSGLKQRAIAGVAKGFVSFIATKNATADQIAAGVKRLTAAVTNSLVAAKVSDAELMAVLKATTEATVGAMMQSDLVKKR
jgi:hypothetical protein